MLLDDDVDFRKRFSSYVAANCSHIALSLTDGSAGGDLQRWLEKDPDLVLMDAGSGLLEELIAARRADRTVVLLPREPGGKSVDDQGVRYIFKYIGASSLISSVPELASGFGQVKICRKNAGDMLLSAVTGFFGGCGKTSFAVALARLNRTQRERTTLLISTELYPDLEGFFPNGAGMVSDSNLLLLNHLSGFRVTPARFLLEDSCGVFALAPPAGGPSDLNDLTEEDMAGLLEKIRDWDMFDSIVFDTGRGDHRLDRFLFNNADSMFILHDARRAADRAEKRWLEKLYQSVERTPVIHIVNFAAAGGAAGQPGHFELPADPGSFSRKNGYTEISLTGRYADALSRILKGNDYLI